MTSGKNAETILVASFPFWPAAIFEPEDPTIRPELLLEFEQKKDEERRNRTKRKVYIVQFYDTRRTWYVRRRDVFSTLFGLVYSTIVRCRGVVSETDAALLAEDKGPSVCSYLVTHNN